MSEKNKKRSEKQVESEITAYMRRIDKGLPEALRRTLIRREVRKIENEKITLKEEIQNIEQERRAAEGIGETDSVPEKISGQDEGIDSQE